MAEPAYRIDVEEQDFVVRVRRDAVDRDEVSRFLDFLELESIRRRSELTEEDAARLADEIDASVWERYRSRVEGVIPRGGCSHTRRGRYEHPFLCPPAAGNPLHRDSSPGGVPFFVGESVPTELFKHKEDPSCQPPGG